MQARHQSYQYDLEMWWYCMVLNVGFCSVQAVAFLGRAEQLWPGLGRDVCVCTCSTRLCEGFPWNVHVLSAMWGWMGDALSTP